MLLIVKKRGLGAGNINGPGGKLDPGETPLECAIRETQEELLITPEGVSFVAELLFHAYDFPRIHAFAYIATGFTGVPQETDEAIPVWYPFERIPYERMWQDDSYWLPRVIKGERLNLFLMIKLLKHFLRFDLNTPRLQWKQELKVL